jgi:hypothetical protein
MSTDAQEEGLVEGSAVEASTGIRFHFKGHFLVVRQTGHFAVWVEDSVGEHGNSLAGTLRLTGAGAQAEVVAAIERKISAGGRMRSA